MEVQAGVNPIPPLTRSMKGPKGKRAAVAKGWPNPFRALTTAFKDHLGSRPRLEAAAIIFVLVALLTVFIPIGTLAKRVIGSSRACRFPAIYNFGDSNSDTGSVSAAFGRIPHPYGETFFGRRSGRYSDGRVTIDFIAKELGLPYLSSYLDAMEGNFQRGANFAASGSTISSVDGKIYESGMNPLSLRIQLLQFVQLKERTSELYRRGENSLIRQKRLPIVSEFSKALYTIDIGQNDLHYGLTTTIEDEVRKSIPKLIDQLASAIEKLHQQGARKFWIHNTGPIGCLPYFVVKNPPRAENADSVGCVKSYNEVAGEFNRQLKDKVAELRVQLQDSLLVYVDIYSAKYYLIKEAIKNGFVKPLGFCCTHPGNPELRCWDQQIINGTEVFASSCRNPAQYISWDSVHYTEAANQWVASQIFDGSLSEPPLPIAEACGNAAPLRK